MKERWEKRRLELLGKQARECLSNREREELRLVEECVDFYLQNEIPHKTSLELIVDKLKQIGINL